MQHSRSTFYRRACRPLKSDLLQVFLNGIKVGGVDNRVQSAYPFAWGELRAAPAVASIPVALQAGDNFLDGARARLLLPLYATEPWRLW